MSLDKNEIEIITQIIKEMMTIMNSMISESRIGTDIFKKKRASERDVKHECPA